jgi:uncharacterized ion transporter superfamily protein YfcC
MITFFYVILIAASAYLIPAGCFAFFKLTRMCTERRVADEKLERHGK